MVSVEKRGYRVGPGVMLGLVLVVLTSFLVYLHLGVDDAPRTTAQAAAGGGLASRGAVGVSADPAGLPGSSPAYLAGSPAAALTSGRPSVFLFYPVEICQLRYCRPPEWIDAGLTRRYEDKVEFVTVRTYVTQSAVISTLQMENWDLYPVPPYSDWLPKPAPTWLGFGLGAAPVLLVIDAEGELVYEGDESTAVAEIAPALDGLLAPVAQRPR